MKIRVILYILIFVLAFLHQDFWNFDDATLCWGFLPIGLAYHAGYTIAAVVLWYFMIRFASPKYNTSNSEFGECK